MQNRHDDSPGAYAAYLREILRARVPRVELTALLLAEGRAAQLRREPQRRTHATARVVVLEQPVERLEHLAVTT